MKWVFPRCRVVEEVAPRLAGGEDGRPLISDKIYKDISFYTLKMLALALTSFR